jgi:hypothetical protein
VEDLDGEVLALLPEDLLVLLLQDLAGPVVRIDDAVADLELDALDLALDLEILEKLLFGDVGDGVPPSGPGLVKLGFRQVCR